MMDWLKITRREAPLIVSIPHAGTKLIDYADTFKNDWLARRDADWHIPKLYAFAAEMGATVIQTELSRSIIDVNRNANGTPLYPGQATTELCPTTTFDGEPLYDDGQAPDDNEIIERRAMYFAPYHAALAGEVARLKEKHKRVAVYDAHSIRSVIPRLFEGELPLYNLGTNSGQSCSPALRERLTAILADSGDSFVVDGRFKGGGITRSLGRPRDGVEAVQLELACRAYMEEPDRIDETNWPTPFDPARAAKTQATLRRLLAALLDL